MQTALERKGNVSYITRDNQNLMLYLSIHGQHDFGTIPVDQSKLPQKVGAFDIEMPNNWTADPLGYLYAARSSRFFDGVFKKAEEEKIPIYFTDFTYDHNLALNIGNNGLKGLEVGLAWVVANKLRKPVSRRRFLKTSIAIPAVAWLTSPILSDWSLASQYVTGRMPEPALEYAKFSRKVHPEIDLKHRIRDIASSYKQDYILSRLQNDQQLTIIRGPAHVGMEYEIMDAAENKLQKLKLVKEPIRHFIDIPGFCSIGRFDFNNKWQFTEGLILEELREIVEA